MFASAAGAAVGCVLSWSMDGMASRHDAGSQHNCCQQHKDVSSDRSVILMFDFLFFFIYSVEYDWNVL